MGLLRNFLNISKSNVNEETSVVWKEFEDQLMCESMYTQGTVPYALNLLTSKIRRHLDAEGLFRTNGEISTVNAAVEQFKEKVRLPEAAPPQLYCEILNRWIMERNRAEPFITKHTQNELAKIFLSQDSRVEKFLKSIKCLIHESPLHLQMIQHLFKFLHEVSEHCESNKMTAKNLSNIFQVTLMEHLVMKLSQADNFPCHLSLLQLFVTELIKEPSRLRGFTSLETVQLPLPFPFDFQRHCIETLKKKLTSLKTYQRKTFRIPHLKACRDYTSPLTPVEGEPQGLKYTRLDV